MFKLKKTDLRMVLALSLVLVFSLDLGCILLLFYLAYSLLIREKINPLKFYIFTWLLVIVIYFLGPVDYYLAVDSLSGLWFLAFSIVAFAIGYVSVNPEVSNSTGSHKDLFPRYFLGLAVVGVFLTIMGGYQSSGNLNRLDLAEIRSNLFQEVSIYAQLGSIFFAFYIFVTIEFLHSKNFNYPNLTRIVILGGLVTPLFTAGRQLYLYFFLLVVLTIYYKKSYAGNGVSVLPVRKSNFLKISAVLALFLVTLVSILRFNHSSAEAFGSKLEMFERYSSVQINPSYKELYDKMPVPLQGLIVEGSYYFGAQVGRFSEFYGLNKLDAVRFDPLSKFPFLDRNIKKFTSLFYREGVEEKPTLIYGNISSFTWATAMSGNILYFGVLGSLLVNFIFGLICKFSFAAYRKFPNSIYAHNFIIANSIIIFYGIIASPLMDTFFFFYYFISFYMFFSRVRFLKRRPQFLI